MKFIIQGIIAFYVMGLVSLWWFHRIFASTTLKPMTVAVPHDERILDPKKLSKAPIDEGILHHILDYAGVRNDVLPKIRQNVVSWDIILVNRLPTECNEHWHSLNIYTGRMGMTEIALKLKTLVEYMRSTDREMKCYNHVRKIRFYVSCLMPAIALIKIVFEMADSHPLLEMVRLENRCTKIRVGLVSMGRKKYTDHFPPLNESGAYFDWLKPSFFTNTDDIIAHSPKRAIKISIIHDSEVKVGYCHFGSSRGLRMLKIHAIVRAISLPVSLEELSIRCGMIMFSTISQSLTRLSHLRRLSFAGFIQAEDAQAITNLLNMSSLRALSLEGWSFLFPAILTLGHVVSNLEKMQLQDVGLSTRSALDENSFRNLQIFSRKRLCSNGSFQLLGLDVRRVAWPDLATVLNAKPLRSVPRNLEIVAMTAHIMNMENYIELSKGISELTHLQWIKITVYSKALIDNMALNFVSEHLQIVHVHAEKRENGLRLSVITPLKLPELIVEGVSRLEHTSVDFLTTRYCDNIRIYSQSERTSFHDIYDCKIDLTISANAGGTYFCDELPRQSKIESDSARPTHAHTDHLVGHSRNMNQRSIDQYLGTSREAMLVKEFFQRKSRFFPPDRVICIRKITEMCDVQSEKKELYLYFNVAKVSFISNGHFQVATVPADGIVSSWWSDTTFWMSYTLIGSIIIGDEIFDALEKIYAHPRE